ncbi:MAG: 4-alpha-glucanotransferase, partial [Elusimicrobia bacterium]|nr:4-alpha-glucanotransferase [Elusimicrobiota bacterium]
MHYLLEKKHTGILIPLFSMRSKKDWGIGDIKVMAEWFAVLREMKIDVLQILPINEMPPGTNCPYTALSAFAIDPLYIAVEEAQDLQECPEAAEKMKSKEFKDKLKKLRSSKTILYEEIKQTKFLILWDIYLSFRQNHVVKNTQRAQEFHEFSLANAYWLDDYAVFRR